MDNQPPLFDVEEEAPVPKRLRDMHTYYGTHPGKTCAACVHLLRFKRGTTWFKCDLTKQSGSTATDWRAGWPACGRYEEVKE